MNELQVFNSPAFGEIRTLEIDGEPWFVGKDVAQALGYKEPTKAARERVDDEDKGVSKIDTPSGTQQMTIINESGLYSLVLSSKLPTAKEFKRWVTSEILPAIRKTGGYITGQENLSDDELIARALIVAKKKIEERNALIKQQQKQIEADKPKVIFADAVNTSKTSILIGDLAKLISQNGYAIGQKRLFEWMRQNGFLIKSGSSKNMPTQRYVEQGLFEIRESSILNADGSVRITKTTKVTGKGQMYFVNKFLEDKCIAE